MGGESDFKTMLEHRARDLLFEWLRERGHTIVDERWPDEERRGQQPQASGKTVDLTFREDGRPVAVEITELHESEPDAQTLAQTADFAARLERELGPQVRERQPGTTVGIAYFGRFPKARSEWEEAFQVVKSGILTAVDALSPGETVDVESRPESIEQLIVACMESPTPSFGVSIIPIGQSMYLPQATASAVDMLLGAENKPPQLAGYDDARILAIDRALVSPVEVETAVAARKDRIPSNWTAIYLVSQGRLFEVWSRGSSGIDR